jgi:ATP-binding cassette subfamily B protein
MSGIIYAFVAIKALFGSFSVGNIVQYVASLSQFGSGVSGLMSNITTLMLNTDALGEFFKFIDMPDVKYHGTLTTEKRADNNYEIEFHNVSFKYPGSDVYALKNLNLKFNIGQRMAVVGMNGSGKTTMIKLLCRLYDPTEGEITLNGIDIKKYDYSEFMSIFSVVFQDFRLFSFSLGQNVAASVDVNIQKAVKRLEMAGFSERIAAMPKGLDTPLYKDFEEDGVEISGGEAQKIALARALYKDAPFIVLDEPTAALDPIAEFEVYSKFNEMIGDKTAVYISHRLSSCRFCDDIAVFHEGELIQRGSHEMLIADKGGKYYELWSAQAQYYNEEAVS